MKFNVYTSKIFSFITKMLAILLALFIMPNNIYAEETTTPVSEESVLLTNLVSDTGTLTYYS